jgi:hypothetical protein
MAQYAEGYTFAAVWVSGQITSAMSLVHQDDPLLGRLLSVFLYLFLYALPIVCPFFHCRDV